MDITKMKLGAIPSEYDPRDYSVKMIRAVTFPEEYDQPDVEIYNQGSIGNCVMQAIRSAPHVHYSKEFGGTFGYGYWRDDGYQGEGMHPNTACNGFVRDGIPPVIVDKQWLEVPEAISYANANKAAMLKAAEPYRGWKWARLYTVDEIKAAIMQGLYVIVCLPYIAIVGGRWVVDGRINGYHEMRFRGWKKTGWKVRNSWGKSGSGSLGGTSDGYVMLNFEDAFACNDVICLFPPEKKEDDIVEARRTLRLKDPYMRGNDVTEYQTKVKAHGFNPGTIDGVFGKNSDAAARAFQKAKSLTVDGIVGVKTWAALDKDPDGGSSAYDIDAIEAMMEVMRGDEYIIGAQNHELTKEYLDERRAAKPGYFDTKRYNWLVERIALAATLGRTLRCEDCSGLLMACNDVLHFWPDKDLSAQGIYKKCAGILRSDLRPGDILVRAEGGEIVHMAWIGRKGIYEAAGIAYGVVFRTSADDRATLNRITGKIDMLEPWTGCARPLESIYANS